MFKKFKISDVFYKIDTPKIKAKANDFPTEYSEEYCVPLLTAGAENQGLNRYAKTSDCPMTINNVISVSANGANSGICFYQPHDFAVLQDAYAVKVNGREIDGVEEGLYLTGALNKAVRDNHDWVNKAGWYHIKDDNIELPVIENLNPDHEYTVDDIDWQYMRDYITELEQERITELEQERITELDAYLQATGLNDYELTEDDKKILSLSAKRASDEDGTLEDNSKDEIKFGEFDVSDIYAVQRVQHKLNKSQIKSEGDYPCFSSDTTNNGILGYTDYPEFHISDETKVYIIFGDHTRTFNIATTDFSVLDNVKVLKPVTNNIKALQYINSVWGKSIPNLGYARHWSVAKDKKLLLPIKSDGTPDFDYMERYIRAMEKVVIADVVKYKDKVIEETRKVVGV